MTNFLTKSNLIKYFKRLLLLTPLIILMIFLCLSKLEQWLKILIGMVSWDIYRIFIQAWVNRKFMKQDFDEIDKALDTVEEKIEEENGD